MRRIRVIFWLLCGSIVMRAGILHAQYTGDYQTNIISGVVSNWSGDYIVGSADHNHQPNDVLLIESGGYLSDSNGAVGPQNGNNYAIVSGSGSVWDNSGNLSVGFQGRENYLIITNGGVVYDNNGSTASLGPLDLGAGTVFVVGSGSVWSNRNDLSLYTGGYRPFMISDGGKVFNNNAAMSTDLGGLAIITGKGSLWSINGKLILNAQDSTMIVSNGGVVNSGAARVLAFAFSSLITGTGSTWNVGGDLEPFGGPLNRLTISDGGEVNVAGICTTTSGGTISVFGGKFCVTNGTASGLLRVGDSKIIIDGGGLMILDQLVIDNPGYGTAEFNGGMLRSKGSTIASSSGFIVGNGTDSATFIMDKGGTGFHSFANGLMISSNGTLRGFGTVVGATTVNQGGLLSPGMSPGSITFSNSLTLAPNSTFAVELDGNAEGQYDRIVALDTVTLSNSVLNVLLGFTPSAGDSFTIISNLSATAVLGTFVTTDGAALPDGATFVVDGTTFQIDYNANADGQDVILIALIPEPSSLLLGALGVVLVWTVLRRRRA